MLPQANSMIANRIVPRIRDLGDGFHVRRALPDAHRRSVGPFVFFDQMGPVVLRGARALDVRPHPHIGLATVTYLFEGEILHRDSLGTVQTIRAGEVNWMTAGQGIVHSERTPPGLRGIESRLFGIQIWVALPVEHEERAPEFSHHENLPLFQENGVGVRLILGDLFGMSSPVPTISPMFYADVSLAAGKGIAIPADPDERAVYVVEGALEIGDQLFKEGELLVFEMGVDVRLRAAPGARIVVFGGPALESPRYVWWNFVSSRRERIEQAAEDWRAGRFPTVPGETEFIPLPARGPRWVDYP
jgi:redox-sensitive bicupin YhaK (pirin superfamily)